MISFLNDYNYIASKDILDAFFNYSNEAYSGYAEDLHTKNAIKLIQSKINGNSDIYFLSGGTITNRIGLYQMLRPYEAVICVSSGHINVHETGAVESTGHKILTVKGKNGKIDLNEVEELLNDHTDRHKVLPKVIYISNSTEIGTIYSKKELIEIYNFTRVHNLYLFIDGARLGVALTADNNDITLEDLSHYSDMFYIGATKNGAPYGEALVINNDSLKDGFKYLVKNQGGLFAKGFVLGIIFETLFTNDLYFKYARNSNLMAQNLRKVFKKYGIDEAYPNNTNQVFVRLNDKQLNKLKEEVLFEIWEKKDSYYIARFVTNFNSNLQEINKIEKILEQL